MVGNNSFTQSSPFHVHVFGNIKPPDLCYSKSEDMRLINTSTFEIQDFKQNEVQPYAILSHQWSEKEILFQDLAKLSKDQLGNANTIRPKSGWRRMIDLLPATTTKIGDSPDGANRNGKSYIRKEPHNTCDPSKDPSLYKLLGACAKAREQNLEWVWIDNCCVNKESSSELSKSLNSMFAWYKEARVCYAYLADVPDRPIDESQWFTRGWTLQELLAPTKMVFFDKNWSLPGTKQELSAQIQKATNISRQHLDNFRPASVATKMSWIARRSTTEPEDMAYSMLGIFEVSLDIRYGVGLKEAFTRLQEAIITHIRDESIFAWKSNALKFSGLLAPAPEYFSKSGGIYRRPDKEHSRSYDLKWQAVKIGTPFYLVPRVWKSRRKPIKFPIQCWVDVEGKPQAIYLYLQRVGNQWRRIRCDEFYLKDSIKWTGWFYKLEPERNWFLDIEVAQEETSFEK